MRRIVEGETKFSKIGKFHQTGTGGVTKADIKALDLQQLFLSMTEEVLPSLPFGHAVLAACHATAFHQLLEGLAALDTTAQGLRCWSDRTSFLEV